MKLPLRTAPHVEVDAAGKPVDLAAVRRRGLIVIGRRILALRAEAIAEGRLPPPLDAVEVEALRLATIARDS